MQKRKIVKISLIYIALCIFLFGIYKLFMYIRVKTAKVEIVLQDDLTTPFLSEKKISDFIIHMNGNIVHDQKINTTKIGEKNINFEFINEDGIKVPYRFKIEVKDVTKPVIWLNNSYTIYKGNDVDIASTILCGDDEDKNPNCFLEGEYDFNTVGEYPLTFKAIDRSGNETLQDFILHVVEPKKNTSNSTQEKKATLFSDVYASYKNEKTKIGIDVSGWQGDIDFEKINL